MVIALGEHSDNGQRFGVARVEDEKIDYSAIHVRWFDAPAEFGLYKEAFLPDHRPWEQVMAYDCMSTWFPALKDGRIPQDKADWIRNNLQELSVLDTEGD